MIESSTSALPSSTAPAKNSVTIRYSRSGVISTTPSGLAVGRPAPRGLATFGGNPPAGGEIPPKVVAGGAASPAPGGRALRTGSALETAAGPPAPPPAPTPPDRF